MIVVEALIRIGKRALKTKLLYGIALAAFLWRSSFSTRRSRSSSSAAALIGYLVARASPAAGRPERRRAVMAPARRTAGGSSSPRRVVGADRRGGRRSRWPRSLLGPTTCWPTIGLFFSKLAVVQLRRRLRAARLHGAAGGRDPRLDDGARNGRRSRPGRDHAGAAHSGDAIRRLPRRLPRCRAVLAGDRRHPRRRDDHVGDVHALDAVDLRGRAVRRATARQPASSRARSPRSRRRWSA